MAMLNVNPKLTPRGTLTVEDAMNPVERPVDGNESGGGAGGGWAGGNSPTGGEITPPEYTPPEKAPKYIRPLETEFPEKPIPKLPPVSIIPPYNPPPIPPATLDAVVTLSKTSAERTYVKGSMRSISNDYIVATNTSTTLTVTIKFTGIAGITFEPTQFNLAPLEQKTITVNFNPVEIEKLPEGSSEITTIIDITTISAIEEPITIHPPKIDKISPIPDIVPPIINPKIEKPTFMGGTYDWTTNIVGGGGSLSGPDKSADAI